MKYLYIILTISSLYSFEVNTHQAITKCAIENNKNRCNKQGASNLHKFAKNMGLNDISYENEIFEKYAKKYFLCAQNLI